MPDAFMRLEQGYQDRVDQVMAWREACDRLAAASAEDETNPREP